MTCPVCREAQLELREARARVAEVQAWHARIAEAELKLIGARYLLLELLREVRAELDPSRKTSLCAKVDAALGGGL